MSVDDFQKCIESRSRMYGAGQVMDKSQCVSLSVSVKHSRKFETQVALIVAANLLSRMTNNIAFDIPSVPIHGALPWKNKTLDRFIRDDVCLNRPDQKYQFRKPLDADFILNIGPDGGKVNIHGSGWFGFVGNASSPMPEQKVLNPIGAATASIIAVALLFGETLCPIDNNYLFDAFKWQTGNIKYVDYPYHSFPILGDLWFVGLGSVGSSTLYFLSLATRSFNPTLIDKDRVKIENMDRSPIFRLQDKGIYKVDAAKIYLDSIGVDGTITENVPFCVSESSVLKNRITGEPDIIISAANEENVRYKTELAMPPIQIYATTGDDGQATLFRHIPFIDCCSCCIFPAEEHKAKTVCASGLIEDKKTGKKVDAALPFLSFMAGLMAASEVLKLTLPNYPFTKNKVTFWSSYNKKHPKILHQNPQALEGCICQVSDNEVHQRMIAGSRYAKLSGIDTVTLEETQIQIASESELNKVDN